MYIYIFIYIYLFICLYIQGSLSSNNMFFFLQCLIHLNIQELLGGLPHLPPFRAKIRISKRLGTINQHFTTSLVSVWLHAKGGHQAIEVSAATCCPTATRATTDAIAALFVGAVGTDARNVYPTGELGRRQSIHQVFRRLKTWILLIPGICPSNMKQYETIWNKMKQYQTIWINMKQHETIWNTRSGLEMPEKNADLHWLWMSSESTSMSSQWTGTAKIQVTHSR